VHLLHLLLCCSQHRVLYVHRRCMPLLHVCCCTALEHRQQLAAPRVARGRGRGRLGRPQHASLELLCGHHVAWRALRRDLATQGRAAGRWHNSIKRGCLWQLWGRCRRCRTKVVLLLLALWLQAGLVLLAKRAQHLWPGRHGWHRHLLLLCCCCIFAKPIGSL
jgi:hypothetical protein